MEQRTAFQLADVYWTLLLAAFYVLWSNVSFMAGLAGCDHNASIISSYIRYVSSPSVWAVKYDQTCHNLMYRLNCTQQVKL